MSGKDACSCDPEAYDLGPEGQRRYFEDRGCPLHGDPEWIAKQDAESTDATSTRLVRSGRGGATIHLSTCSRAKGRIVAPWVWAEGRDDDEWIVKGWLHPCRSCLPELARQQDALKAANITRLSRY